MHPHGSSLTMSLGPYACACSLSFLSAIHAYSVGISARDRSNRTHSTGISARDGGILASSEGEKSTLVVASSCPASAAANPDQDKRAEQKPPPPHGSRRPLGVSHEMRKRVAQLALGCLVRLSKPLLVRHGHNVPAVHLKPACW